MIVRRTALRYLLLFVLLLGPGIALTIYAVGQTVSDMIGSIHSSLHYSDQDFTALRNEGHVWMRQNYPLFDEEEQMIGVHDSLPAMTSFPHLDQVRDYFSTHAIDSSNIWSLVLSALLLALGGFALLAAMIDLAVVVFEERELKLTETIRDVFRRHLWRMLALYALWWVLTIALEILAVALPAVSVLLFLFEIWLLLRFVAALPALVSEELGPRTALRRSIFLTRGNLIKVLGFCVASIILAFFGSILVSFVTSPLFAPLMKSAAGIARNSVVSYAWLMSAVPSLAQGLILEAAIFLLLLTPFTPVFFTVLYYDLRTRKDGPLIYME